MTPQQFITKWGPGGPAFELNERQGAQPHFMDLCELLGVPTPGSLHDDLDYIFEQNTLVLGEARGYADVFKRNHFAWENKAPGKNLDAALKQLLTYSLALANPPLLVVCDRLTIRIHTQFNGHPSETHTVLLNQLDQPDKLALLRRVWLDPESFRPKITSRDITDAAANSFATLAEGLRRRNAKLDDSAATQEARANQVAHFLTQCLFCFFAEDVGLLPGRMFERLVNNKKLTSERLHQGLHDLFTTMRNGGMFGVDDIPWFNGGLFKRIDIPALSIMDMTELRNAAALNWSAIDVSIFGTLFERGLDPAKRSQLGAHYTDPATIMRIVTPVIERPLLQLWELVAFDLRGLMAKSRKKGDASYRAARERFVKWLEELAAYRILDPACGSGNFLFLGLKALKDIEHKSHLDAVALGMDRETDLVTGPHNLLGIELNEYAAELARVTVWIGELQWRMAHGYDFKTNPILEPLDHIECRDALLTWSDPAPARPELVEGAGATPGVQAGQRPGAQHPADALIVRQTSAPPAPLRSLNEGKENGARHATEATWPRASVVIGNPPFLGGSKKSGELGSAYLDALNTVYEGVVPGFADLVCYWFAKALKAIERNGLGAAGLVSTNSIRGGANRKVLDAIVGRSKIYEAWSDEPWMNNGASVRVSLICFGHVAGSKLNGVSVETIHADLMSGSTDGSTANLTLAKPLKENVSTCCYGSQEKGSFELTRREVQSMLQSPNPHGKSNAVVIKRSINGRQLTHRRADAWVVDFGNDMTVVDASLYEAPFGHIKHVVYPERIGRADKGQAKRWWLHARPSPVYRNYLKEGSLRALVSSAVAKHRSFSWIFASELADHALIVITRADDTTFGILHSRFHELWSLRMCTWLGVGNDPRYTPTTCFETFPFPRGLTPADTAHQRTETLEGGAVIPADVSELKSSFFHVLIEYFATNRIANEVSMPNRPPTGASTNPTGTTVGSTPQPKLSLRTAAIAIATAAKHLTDLRDNWLNPKEWTHAVKEVTPLGMDHSPYPDRIEPKPGISEEDLKALQKRTLTNLYNLRPSWLAMAHAQLDEAVAAAYGWADYTAAMPDDEILRRLLALNLERSNLTLTCDTKK